MLHQNHLRYFALAFQKWGRCLLHSGGGSGKLLKYNPDLEARALCLKNTLLHLSFSWQKYFSDVMLEDDIAYSI